MLVLLLLCSFVFASAADGGDLVLTGAVTEGNFFDGAFVSVAVVNDVLMVAFAAISAIAIVDGAVIVGPAATVITGNKIISGD